MDSTAGQTRARTRQPGAKCASRACDQCRMRKTRCSLSRPCAECIHTGLECTFLQPQKKRGPPSRRVAQIRQQQQESQAAMSPSRSPSGTTGISEPLPLLPNLEPPPVMATGSAHETQMQIPIPHAHQQQDYNSSLVGDPTTTAWNDASDLEYWLPDSFNSQASPSFGFPGSSIFVKQTLPPIIDENVNLTLGNTPSFLPRTTITPDMQPENLNGVLPHGEHVSSVFQNQGEIWPPYINETSLIPWLDVYFERLHATLPVLNRSILFTKLVLHEHRRNPQFGAMLLSLCAFALTQPIDISERPTSSSRSDQAKVLVQEATRMRSASADFGENPTIDAVLTSFFLFGYLFGSGQHNAARLRLREAVDLASTLGLNNPASYADCSSAEVKGQWLRTYLVLTVTERAYALQRQHPLTFTGPRPHEIIRSAADEIISCTTQRLDVSGIIVHTEKEAAGMLGLSLLMEIFDAIDEEILICWNARCSASTKHGDGKCQILTEAKVLSIYRNLARVGSGAGRYGSNKRKNDEYFELDAGETGGSDDTRVRTTTPVPTPTSPELNSVKTFRTFLSETQCADILLTRKWVQDRVWNLCFTHGLLQPDLETEQAELKLTYAVDNAARAMELCRVLRISTIEAHGVGIIEKLYDIAASALLLANTNTATQTDIEGGRTSLQVLAKNYLKLMQTLRGGNHPYLPRYKAHLTALGWA